MEDSGDVPERIHGKTKRNCSYYGYFDSARGHFEVRSSAVVLRNTEDRNSGRYC